MSQKFPFKYAERCLYEYTENCARLERLREKLTRLYESSTVGVQSWDAPDRSTGAGDPVAVRELKILTVEEEIARLAARVEPITRLMAALEAPLAPEGSSYERMGKLIRLWYFGHVARERIPARLGLSRSAAFRLRQQAVEMAVKYIQNNLNTLKSPRFWD